MQAIDGFRKNYLAVAQNGSTPIDYPYTYNFATNTGKQITGMDLDKDGKVGSPDDAIGFGQYHGQYAFTVLSRYPLDTDNMRTFQNFKWKDIRATNPVIADKESCNAARDKKDNGPIYNYCLKNIGNAWYTEEEWNNLPLSSKNHVDLPVKLPNNKTVHFLVSHPAPPISDNPIKHNTLRNADEVKFWVDYISGNPADSIYIYDDKGTNGGLMPNASFVIAGDMNADAYVGDGDKGPINNLLNHERINQQISSGNIPTSSGAVEYVQLGVDSRKLFIRKASPIPATSIWTMFYPLPALA